MKNGDIHVDLAGLGKSFSSFARKLNAYKAFLFFLAITTLYGFIVWRINVASNTPASQSEKAAQTTPQPHIDAATVDKMQSLQDNSVSVKTLFDQARKNPFNE